MDLARKKPWSDGFSEVLEFTFDGRHRQNFLGSLQILFRHLHQHATSATDAEAFRLEDVFVLHKGFYSTGTQPHPQQVGILGFAERGNGFQMARREYLRTGKMTIRPCGDGSTLVDAAPQGKRPAATCTLFE